ncbi:glycoside hydrolase family 55 protein [Atractiella rhizophila]|nr:glycoside hydrolase family 55 protein [Atractiella rhizophila]
MRLKGSSSQQGLCDVSFWLEGVKHQGASPFLGDESFQIFRNVKDYGALGDGVADDTDAFNRAIKDGNRCLGGTCDGGVTGRPVLLYVPEGTYVVTSSVQVIIYTQIIGNPLSLPTIKASSNFRASVDSGAVLNGYDPGTGSTTNFFIGIRNIIIDTTDVDSGFALPLLNWAVSQATNLVNVHFEMPKGSKHLGIIMDGGDGGGGSGTFLGDLSFNGGAVGIQLNNQQYSFKNLEFSDVDTAIQVLHLFVGVFQGLWFTNVNIGVDLTTMDDTGSVSVIDSRAQNTSIVLKTDNQRSVLLENIRNADSATTVLLNGNAAVKGSFAGTWALGNVYRDNSGIPKFTSGAIPTTDRGTLTAEDGKYVTKALPQYGQYGAEAFASVKDAGAVGDGRTDDTKAIQQALMENAGCRLTYFPHGVYLVTDTIYVPPGSRIVGEVWSIVAASGKAFSDENNPKAMLRVGEPGEVGVAEFVDMIFTVSDVLPGAIVVEVSMAGESKGDVSFHNTHIRIGGSQDSKTETQCQEDGSPCKAAFLMMHLKETSQTYMENMWLWSADHDLDADFNQVIGTGRGYLTESTKGSWFVGTGSEHHILYAYQFLNAANVYVGMAQIETPYFQPAPLAPTPWNPNADWNDPTFDNCPVGDDTCRMQWAIRIVGGSHQNIYGAGSWAFFNNFGGCDGDCQKVQSHLFGNDNEGDVHATVLYNMNTRFVSFLLKWTKDEYIIFRSVTNVVTLNGQGVAKAADNLGSWGAKVTAYLGLLP